MLQVTVKAAAHFLCFQCFSADEGSLTAAAHDCLALAISAATLSGVQSLFSVATRPCSQQCWSRAPQVCAPLAKPLATFEHFSKLCSRYLLELLEVGVTDNIKSYDSAGETVAVSEKIGLYATIQYLCVV